MLLTRTETNHCALCQTEVNNLCQFETIFCSEYCHWHMYNYAEDPDEKEDDEWVEEEQEINEMPFAEWKIFKKSGIVNLNE